ncbi:MAG: hypothetical protein C4K58_03280 [Flavobacteriaceae bacterium]|nr:MAG: hypothetical protein C4K58_03280 [Flavobacteriaceae bacterium]
MEIFIPPLRERKADIHLLFRKFAVDFAQKYNMPTLQLEEGAIKMLENFPWPGNIRQLRNFVEHLSVVEPKRQIGPEILKNYLPDSNFSPSVIKSSRQDSESFSSEREILYKVLFDVKQDLNNLRNLTLELLEKGKDSKATINPQLIQEVIQSAYPSEAKDENNLPTTLTKQEENTSKAFFEEPEYIDLPSEIESLSIQQKEEELIRKALEKHAGKRKNAADELGISERTLYRKIKQFNIES